MFRRIEFGNSAGLIRGCVIKSYPTLSILLLFFLLDSYFGSFGLQLWNNLDVELMLLWGADLIS